METPFLPQQAGLPVRSIKFSTSSFGGSNFPCKIWRSPRAEPLVARLCGSAASAQTATAQAADPYGLTASERQILHESNDYPLLGGLASDFEIIARFRTQR